MIASWRETLLGRGRDEDCSSPLEADDGVVRIADHNHVARRLVPTPAMVARFAAHGKSRGADGVL
jgi:hypothetical protein